MRLDNSCEKTFNLIGLEQVTVTDSHLHTCVQDFDSHLQDFYNFYKYFLQVCALWVYYRCIVQTTIYYLNKSDTEMSVSTRRRSEPLRPLVVPSLRSGHYSPGPLRFTTMRRYLHFSV